MLIRCDGSSLVEVLVALVLVTVCGISLATIQREAGFMQQQLLWRWQARQWLSVLASADLYSPYLSSSFAYPCNNTPPEFDCYQQQCAPSDAEIWQRQRLCYAMHQASPNTVVVLKPCEQGTCLSMAATVEIAQRCEAGMSYCLLQPVSGG